MSNGEPGTAASARIGTRRGWRHARLAVVPAALALAVLAGCTSNSSGKPAAAAPKPVVSTSSSSPAPIVPDTSSAPPPVVVPSTPSVEPVGPITFSASPAATAARDINPRVPISVSVANGTLTSVVLTNSAGKKVTGALSEDGTTWHSTEALGYDKTYKLAAAAANPTNASTSSYKSTITTVAPDNLTMPYLNTIYGNSMVNGATYGIGMIPVVHFDESITNKAAAEKALVVTTSPHVDGSWTWADSQDAHWRPKAYYAPGTKVTIDAKVYGVEVGQGLYGQADKSVSFTIGESHISIADDKTHNVKVYFGGKLVKTMPTSMGKHSGIQLSTGYISYYTMDGTYTVIGHENPAIMSSASYGLPADAPGGYAPEKIYWSTKISTDGIYLHELDTTTWAQGNTDVSHGCLNLNEKNAEWFFEHSRVGDVVVVKNNGGPKITLGQGGDWSVPWTTWVKGSALA